MSYKTINQCVHDDAFVGRVNACVATQGFTPPDATTYDILWDVASASDIEAAYASALAGDNPDPGGDEGVITDQMILSSVQAHLPSQEPPA